MGQTSLSSSTSMDCHELVEKKCLQSSGRGGETGPLVLVLLIGKQCASRSNKETWDDANWSNRMHPLMLA